MTEATPNDLRPCPFCGGPAESRNGQAFCSRKPYCAGNNWAWHYEIWNSAYCWKEIDRLNKRIEELELAVAEFRRIAVGLQVSDDDGHIIVDNFYLLDKAAEKLFEVIEREGR